MLGCDLGTEFVKFVKLKQRADGRFEIFEYGKNPEGYSNRPLPEVTRLILSLDDLREIGDDLHAIMNPPPAEAPPAPTPTPEPATTESDATQAAAEATPTTNAATQAQE